MQELTQKVREKSKRSERKAKIIKLTDIPDKLYFTMGETSKLCAVESYVVRFWERTFSQLKPAKISDGGRRYYDKDGVMLIRTIRNLLYAQGFTTEGARAQLAAKRSGGSDDSVMIDSGDAAIATTVDGGGIDGVVAAKEREWQDEDSSSKVQAEVKAEVQEKVQEKVQLLKEMLRKIEDILFLIEDKTIVEDEEMKTGDIESELGELEAIE